eukprot:6210207-Pleurochrysis_carterae.AAC.2
MACKGQAACETYKHGAHGGQGTRASGSSKAVTGPSGESHAAPKIAQLGRGAGRSLQGIWVGGGRVRHDRRRCTASRALRRGAHWTV